MTYLLLPENLLQAWEVPQIWVIKVDKCLYKCLKHKIVTFSHYQESILKVLHIKIYNLFITESDDIRRNWFKLKMKQFRWFELNLTIINKIHIMIMGLTINKPEQNGLNFHIDIFWWSKQRDKPGFYLTHESIRLINKDISNCKHENHNHGSREFYIFW